MKRLETISIAVAETSVIVRNGLISVLRKLPELNIEPLEITSFDGLNDCMQGHVPDILIINPLFGGFFNVEKFRETYPKEEIKIISLLCSVTDSNLLKGFDDCIELYNSADEIEKKISNLLRLNKDNSEQEALTQREKEVICCIVKGMTNKEMAVHFFLSIHTIITHRRNISRKLQIHSAAGLTIYAIVNKLVDISEVKI